MNDLIPLLLPIVLLVILYVIIFTRKGAIQRMKTGLRGSDWVTFFAVFFGVSALTPAVSALGIVLQPWLMAASVLLLVLLLIVVLNRMRAGKTSLNQVGGDERISLIYAKSCRNALFATYLAFFIHSLFPNANTLDTVWVVIILASGLVVLLASVFFYSYRKS